MAVKVGERNVPDTPQNRQLDAVWYARELALYTIKICQNKNIFIPEYQSSLTDDIDSKGYLYKFVDCEQYPCIRKEQQ